jgi:signal transduction histidine kinase
VPFLDELVRYLDDVRLRTRRGSAVELEPIDPAWVRPIVLAGLSAHRGFELVALHRSWTSSDRDRRFAEVLRAMIVETGFAAREQALDAVRVGIQRQLGDAQAELDSAVRTLELDRLSREAWTLSHILDHAQQVRLVRANDASLEVTAAGEMITRLAGRDALRWLLALELEQSTGPDDPWRISIETLLFLPKTYAHDDREQTSFEQLLHLEELRMVASRREGAFVTRFEATPLWSDVTPSIAQPDSAIRLHARALLEDETVRATTGARIVRATAAAATARQARLVAHEIRNALPPAMESFELLHDGLMTTSARPSLDRHTPSIRRGFSRVFAFVEELLKLSEVSDPPEPFRLLPALEDAFLEGNGGIEHSLTVPEEAAIEGYRKRLVLAVANLVRNARQAGATRVAVSVQPDPSCVLIHVDDDGPGIPVERREPLLRSGPGHGLRLVREIIEEDHRGSLRCLDSPLGGTRFTIALPVAGGTR